MLLVKLPVRSNCSQMRIQLTTNKNRIVLGGGVFECKAIEKECKVVLGMELTILSPPLFE